MNQQLTFGHIRERQRLQRIAAQRHVPNVTVDDRKVAKCIRKQTRRILAMLRAGPVWTNELSAIAKQYNARINEIRKILLDEGKTVDITAKGKHGNNRYEIRPFHGSKYQKYLMAKQANKTTKDTK